MRTIILSEEMVQMFYGILQQLRKAPRLKADEVEELAIHTYACQGVGPGAGPGPDTGPGEAKEERETEEAVSPHTPYYEEEKEKEEKEKDALSLRSRACAKGSTGGIPPSLQEVQAYVKQQGLSVINAQRFHAYYTARGWKVNGVPIVNWKSCLESWVMLERQSAPAPSPATAAQPQAKSYSEERDERMAAMEREWARQERESVTYEEYQRMKAEGRIAR